MRFSLGIRLSIQSFIVMLDPDMDPYSLSMDQTSLVEPVPNPGPKVPYVLASRIRIH